MWRSISPSLQAVKTNLAAMAARRWNVVIGTTGWQNDLEACRAIATQAGIGVLASANFSIGVHVFKQIAAEACAPIRRHAERRRLDS
jgi:4-hydroxy-tetrahydrodipicolinate reductase